MQIFKYALVIDDHQVVAMPQGAVILCAQMQNGRICLWARVDEEVESEQRHIEIFGTGHQMDEAKRAYIGTVQMNGGSLVWHVFERISQ